jgi:hypothetical protein
MPTDSTGLRSILLGGQLSPSRALTFVVRALGVESFGLPADSMPFSPECEKTIRIRFSLGDPSGGRARGLRLEDTRIALRSRPSVLKSALIRLQESPTTAPRMFVTDTLRNPYIEMEMLPRRTT